MICEQLSRWKGVVLGIKAGRTASRAFPLQDTIVKAVRGILMRECANLYKRIKIVTLVIFDMLCLNLPGAKANSQWCRHIRQFKMAAA